MSMAGRVRQQCRLAVVQIIIQILLLCCFGSHFGPYLGYSDIRNRRENSVTERNLLTESRDPFQDELRESSRSVFRKVYSASHRCTVILVGMPKKNLKFCEDNAHLDIAESYASQLLLQNCQISVACAQLSRHTFLIIHIFILY